MFTIGLQAYEGYEGPKILAIIVKEIKMNWVVIQKLNS